MWKTFAGHCIYRSNTGVSVFQNLFFRWLKFDSQAIQTLINRYFPYRPELEYIRPLILAGKLIPGECCLLGLGGGGIVHTFSHLHPVINLTVVEKDAEVIQLASRFFMLDGLNNFKLIHQDANTYLKESNLSFQHLLVDLFDAKAFPADCNNLEFFKNCKRLLKPQGILALNLANHKEQWPIFQFIRKLFAQSTLVLPVIDRSNMVILAQNSDSIKPFLNQLQSLKQLKDLNWDSKWGYVGRI